MIRRILGIPLLLLGALGPIGVLIAFLEGSPTVDTIVGGLLFTGFFVTGLALVWSGNRQGRLEKCLLSGVSEYEKTQMVDVQALSQLCGMDTWKTERTLFALQGRGKIPLTFQFDYPGKNETVGHIPYAMANGAGWDIIFTKSCVVFFRVYEFPWYQQLLRIITLPILWILPPIGAFIDFLNLQGAAAAFRRRSARQESEPLEMRLKRHIGSRTVSLKELKQVTLRRKVILFEEPGGQSTFYLLKPLRKLWPQCRKALEDLGVLVC